MTQNMSAAKPTFQCALTHRLDNACTTDKPEDKNEFVADLEFLEVGQGHIDKTAAVMTSTTCERGAENAISLLHRSPLNETGA